MGNSAVIFLHKRAERLNLKTDERAVMHGYTKRKRKGD